MQYDSQTKKYFFFVMLAGALALGIILLWPFLTIIILAGVLSVLFMPLYRWFNKHVSRNISWVAALLTVITFVLVLCIPLVFIGVAIFDQVQAIYSWIVTQGHIEMAVTKITSYLAHYIPVSSLNLQARASELVGLLTTGIGSVFSKIISGVITFLLVILSMFYFLKDSSQFRRNLIAFSPLSNENSEKIIYKLRIAINGIFKGYLLIALIQGICLGFGLFIFNVPNPALWGGLAALASLIPTFGTSVISIPAVIYLFVTGHTGGAIGLMVWAATLVGTIDNLLNPIIVGSNIEIHPLLVLFSVLGGLALLGPVGILMGPLIISFIYALISVYRSEILSERT